MVEKSDLEHAVATLRKNIAENCSTDSLIWGKKLIRTEELKNELKKVNRIESEYLQRAWQSPDFPKFIAKFFKRK